MLKFPPSKLSYIVLAAAIFVFSTAGAAQTQFRIGERITYSVSLDKFRDIAYAEIYTVSRGALEGKDAIELRAKLKALNFASASTSQGSEVRTTFVDPSTGMPLYGTRVEDPEGIPRETSIDYQPSVNFDLVSLIYKIRHSSGSGAANFQEGEKSYTATFQPSGTEKVSVNAGVFDTTIISVQSQYFTDLGYREVKINLSNDDARVPVLIRLIIDKKSGYRVEAASIQSIVPEQVVVAAPTPSPVAVPRVSPTPARTPEPYTANVPLAPELAFPLGERLEYRVTAGGRPVGAFVMLARERVQIAARDTLVLSATVTNAAPGNPAFALNDYISVNVDPITLAPRVIDIRMRGPLAFLTQSAVFDERTGSITYKASSRVDAPIATHSILSLVYAMRSFNLKPSAIRDNPVNDTRVAVFWESQPYVFTLRPRPIEEITVSGEKRQAQQITINTGNPRLDQLGLKVWLSADGLRVPLRFSAGPYEAELVSQTIVPPGQ